MDVAVARGPPLRSVASQTVTVTLTCADARKRGQRIDVHMKSAIFRGLTMLALSAVLVVAAIAAANAAPLQRLSADFQNNTTILPAGGTGEIFTTARPQEGGRLVYSKTLSIPFKVVYVTFSAQADSHNGSALLMQASVTDSLGITKVCEPMAGQTGEGGDGSSLFPRWMTLLKLPITGLTDSTTPPNNCNDGSGGSADCHDNAIMFSCCLQITPDKKGEDSPPTTHTVKIKLADLPGFLSPSTGNSNNVAFYERSTIYIDATGNAGDEEEGGGGPSLCTGHGVP